jgi:16S rRNA C1402 (ribose-2'-O) methylase RsmI
VSSVHRAPRGLSAAGRRLWDALSSDYELESHELVLLESAARTADLIADLQALIDAEGLVLEVKMDLTEVQQAEVTDALRRIIVKRAVVEQVKGFLMVTYGITADEAFAKLRD